MDKWTNTFSKKPKVLPKNSPSIGWATFVNFQETDNFTQKAKNRPIWSHCLWITNVWIKRGEFYAMNSFWVIKCQFLLKIASLTRY
jgi:hypothetical protein